MSLYSRWQRPSQSFSQGENFKRAEIYSRHALHSAPSFTAKYLREKIPVIEWLPKYSWTWLIRDIMTGLTIGVLLVPQSLAYAKVANIPQQYGLISAWLPTALHVLGTSKDVASGPTVIMALLTGEVVSKFVKEGYSAHVISSAVAFMVGVYSLALGLLKLSFLLDLIPLPVLTGYVSAAALTIIFSEIPAIFGESNIGSSTGDIIHDFFHKLPTSQ